MTTAQIQKLSPRKALRLWPGVVAVVLLWVSRIGVKAVVPGFVGFAYGMQGAILCALAVVLWWAFFSRAARSERLGAIGLMLLGLGTTWLVKHESMGPLWLLGYAVPVLCLAFVAWAVATRRLPDRLRRVSMAATILLACGMWTLVRTDGITGDHVAQFEWRWAASPEERLLASANRDPAAPIAVESPEEPLAAKPAADPAVRPSAPAVADTLAERPVPQTRSGSTTLPSSTAAAKRDDADWPGFRGPTRDGIVRGAHIETDWSRTPPTQLWRRPIGPGWSSFAVRGNRLYTQEQRGDDEVVACYDVTTGRPVWTHRDGVRFFESNGGAGPRGTPTLSNGRVYTFGATGILNALDARDGAVVWSRNAASDTKAELPTWGFASSPLVVGDVVIVATAGQLVAYDALTGNPRWFGPAGGASYSSPQLLTIDGVAQIVLVSEVGATSVGIGDGKRLWEHRWPGYPVVQPALTPDGDILLAVRSDSGTRRIAVAHDARGWTVEARWTSRALKPYFNDFVVHKGHAYGFDGFILASIDVADGTRTWKGGRYGHGQLVLLPEQDLLLVLSEEGELALVRAAPDQFTEVARVPALEGKTWNHPVLVGDILLVRNGQEMAAFRLPLARRLTSGLPSQVEP